MTFTIRPRSLRRLAVMLSAATPLLVAMAAPALASVPPNDDIATATVITSLPFHDTLDMSQATFAPDDQSFCAGQKQSVWYQFTPTTSGEVAFDSTPSNQPMAIDVFTGSPGALNHVGCGQGGGGDGFDGGFLLNATAGTTYWIMASPICCTIDPQLDLTVYPAATPKASIGVSQGARDKAGNAIITGTLNCTGVVPSPVTISGTVTQPAGRQSSVTAPFTATVTCGAPQTWTALAQPAAGKFAGGAATVSIPQVFICNMIKCTQSSDTAVIKLNG
jgi:hypothetical protein